MDDGAGFAARLFPLLWEIAMTKKTRVAEITWLGEDDLHEDGNGPSRNAWNGITFKLGEPVTVKNDRMIAKAKGNRFYSVENEREEDAPPEVPTDDSDADVHGGDLSKMKIGALRWMAEQKGINHDGMSKVELREAIEKADEEAKKA